MRIELLRDHEPATGAQSLTPSVGLVELAKEAIRDHWERHTASAKRLIEAGKLELKLDRSIDQLLDRIVERDSETVVAAYERKLKVLRSGEPNFMIRSLAQTRKSRTQREQLELRSSFSQTLVFFGILGRPARSLWWQNSCFQAAHI
ncbi:MAG: hypothetical protein J7515_03130 [Caulobacter sp.]|nr:hypothetical protein [Caulobacter sp.]